MPSGGVSGVAAKPERARPAFGLGHKRDDRDAELLRCFKHRGFAADLDNQRLGVEIAEVEFEFVLAIGGIERRRGRPGRDAKKRGRHLGPIRQDDGDAVATADAKLVQLGDGAVDERAQTCVGHGRRIVAGDRDRVVSPRCDEASQFGCCALMGARLSKRNGLSLIARRPTSSPLVGEAREGAAAFRATVSVRSFVAA